MIRLGIAPQFLKISPRTGAGRCQHTVAALLRSRTKEPSRWRRADVWLAPVTEQEGLQDERVVAVCHGAEWLRDPSLADFLPTEWFEKFAAATEAGARMAACTIVPSDYTREAIIEGWGIAPDRVATVRYGVDIEKFRPADGEVPARARELVGDRPYVLFLGVPNRAKNALLLKEAMTRLFDEGLPHALVVAGPRPPADIEVPEYSDAVDAEIPGAADRYVRVGEIDDDTIAPLMAGADAFCLPSVKESFGIPVLEAMACGTPVVVGNRAALPEVVGDAGLLCEPTVDDVAATLKRVLSDRSLASELSQRGRRRAEAMTWQHAADGYLAVLERVAATPKRAR
jgi:glycosyltransferase involved in cell wall biosynthesis